MTEPRPGERALPMRSLEDAVRSLNAMAARLSEVEPDPSPKTEAGDDGVLFVHTVDGRTLPRR
ncbi:MAG TPA: hypothetical protein VM889_09235 [Candidatus Thermoplasmatota archaeon]|nr:hypothetical protein [Candidatus Thermoplasmatota archaeon]